MSAPASRPWLGLSERWMRHAASDALRRFERSAVPALVVGQDQSDRARWNMVGGRYDTGGFQALELAAIDVPIEVREVSVRHLTPFVGGAEVWVSVQRGFRTTAFLVPLGGSSYAVANTEGTAARFGRVPGFAPPLGAALVGASQPPGTEWRRSFTSPWLVAAGETFSLMHVTGIGDYTIQWRASA